MTGRRTRVWPGCREFLACCGLPCCGQQGGGVAAAAGGRVYQGGQDGKPLAGAGVHPGLAVLGHLPADDLVRPDGARDSPLRPPGRVVQCPLGQVEVEGADVGQAGPEGDPLLGGAPGFFDLEPLLPGAGDVVGQVQARDAGVVLLDVGPEELAEDVAELLEGRVVQCRLALAEVVNEHVAHCPALQAVSVDHLLGGPRAVGAQLAERGRAGDDAHGLQCPVEHLRSLARTAEGVFLGGVPGDHVADGDLAERAALGRDDGGGAAGRQPAGDGRQLGVGVEQLPQAGEAFGVPLGDQRPGEVVVGHAAAEQPEQ